MKYHTRTKWAGISELLISEDSFKSVKEAAEHVVSTGDFNTGWVCQLFVLHETKSGLIGAAQDCTPEFITACYDYWCEDARTYCPQIIYAEVDERFMFDGEVYVIRKGME